MTYGELLDKWIRKLGRDCTAGEIVHDLRQLEQPVRCKDCKWWTNELPMKTLSGVTKTVIVCGYGYSMNPDGFCFRGERREDGVPVED